MAVRSKRGVRKRADRLKLQADIIARDLFREAARAQRCCQVPGCERPATHEWQAHHVVYEQELRKLARPIFDTRNALRVCADCHRRHHNRIAPIPLAVLDERHFEYAEEVLGERFMDYLKRHYA